MSQSPRPTNINPTLFFSGLILGSVLTALYTPKNGAEMRQRIKNNTERMSENMKSSAADIKQKAQSTKEKAASKIQKSNNNDQPPLPPADA